MRTLTFICLLTTLYSCIEGTTEPSIAKHSNTPLKTEQFEISAIDAAFPLRLNEINFENKKNIVQLNDGIITKIEETIIEHAATISFYDSAQTYKNLYINTIGLHDSLQTIFLVLLLHQPSQAVNSKVLFYDNQNKTISEKPFDFNFHALYNFENGKLQPSNLKTEFKITSPEIEIFDFDNDGRNDFKFIRLWHNGTSNSLQTTILKITNTKLDTLYFVEKPIGND